MQCLQAELNMKWNGREIKSLGEILIAAVAINNDAQLFSFNKRHYEGIPQLQLFICE